MKIEKQILYLLAQMKAKGISFEKGLTEEELLNIKALFQIEFPDDLKMFLQEALPVSNGFVDWRLGLKSEKEQKAIWGRIAWPLEGILFDVFQNNYWRADWGMKPSSKEACEAWVKEHYITYPKLVPIYSHRYIPSEPKEAGNPVFSVYQTDIIYYGFDLANYFSNEFFFPLKKNWVLQDVIRPIHFWSEI